MSIPALNGTTHPSLYRSWCPLIPYICRALSENAYLSRVRAELTIVSSFSSFPVRWSTYSRTARYPRNTARIRDATSMIGRDSSMVIP